MNVKEITLLDVADGGVQEEANLLLKQILDNLADPNCDPDKTRKLTITFTFKGLEQGSVVGVTVEQKISLQPSFPVATTLLVDRNDKGDPVVYEKTKVTPGQFSLDGIEAPPQNVIKLSKAQN